MDGERLTVVIPNYDGARLLPRCLDALATSSRPPDRIVVVDDASRDESLALLASRFPAVDVVALPRNRGFPGAVNAGIERALERTPDGAVFLLNNDAIVEPHTIAELVRGLAEHPECDAFACSMRKDDASATIDSAGITFGRGFAQLSIGDGEQAAPEYLKDATVFGACGGAALFRARFFANVGLFDPRFLAYFEDYDLALRAHLRGVTTRFLAAAAVRHIGSATLGKHSARGTYLYARNSLFVLATAVPLATLLRESPFIALVRARMLGLAIVRRRGIACLLGLLAGTGLLVVHLLRRMLRRDTLADRAPASQRVALEAALREGEALRLRSKLRRSERRGAKR